MYNRRSFIVLTGAAVAASVWSLPVLASESHDLAVWKDPWCGCCGGWVAHMQAAGHAAEVTELEDMEALKDEFGVPAELRSCHTAQIAGYVLEGHVPAQAVEKLLRERPDVIGLAVPGMPLGSPGMGAPEGTPPDTYEVIAFGREGHTSFMRFRGTDVV
ncbi:MAG TPA: DUF411 domain-containing protein [Devosia sp.]|jgi:hypothetical protein|nr:DUF411 domain-containing protein [Devosia sp.]